MKVLYIANSGGVGGSSVALYNLINCIYKDVEVAVVCPGKGSFSNSIESLGIKCYYLPLLKLSDYPFSDSFSDKLMFVYRVFKRCTQAMICYFQLLDIARKWMPDIIHTNVGPLSTGFLVAKKMDIKHVWHLREYQDLDFGIKFFPSANSFKKMLASPNSFSIAITKDIFQYWGLNLDRDKVIYDGVLNALEHSYIPNKKKYFLFVGRIQEAKGLKEVLNAFIDFQKINNHYQLLIAGNGNDKYYNECVTVVKDNALDGDAFFLGHRTDVYELMEEATAIVVPSRFEGFGFITVEAMYNHCLVIGKDTGGTKEQFDFGINLTGNEIGLRYKNEKDLISCLQKATLLSDEERLRIIERAYYTVKKNYTMQRHSENVMNFYKGVIGA